MEEQFIIEEEVNLDVVIQEEVYKEPKVEPQDVQEEFDDFNWYNEHRI